MRNPDVIVVGAGVAGCSTAFRLSQARRNVVVIDQRGIASGASGRNGGMTGIGSAMYADSGDSVYEVTSANFALMKSLPEELGVDFELTLPGTFDVATNQAQLDHVKHSAESQAMAGIRVEMLSADETRYRMPAFGPAVIGAKFTIDAGHLWPFRLVHGFAERARGLGADFRLWTRVTGLLRNGDRIVGVQIGDEQLHAEHVVLCTNAYTPLILPELPAGAIVPARGQILVTQAMPKLLGHPFGTNFDKEYGRQTPDGKILCGGFRRLDDNEGLGHYEERVSAPVLNGIASCLTTLFPALDSVRIVRCWAGIMGFTADGLPIIGRAEWTSGLTIAAGFNGGGFSWGPIVGKIVTALINGDDPGFDLSVFRPGRFSEAGTTWNNPFTADEANSAAA